MCVCVFVGVFAVQQLSSQSAVWRPIWATFLHGCGGLVFVVGVVAELLLVVVSCGFVLCWFVGVFLDCVCCWLLFMCLNTKKNEYNCCSPGLPCLDGQFGKHATKFVHCADRHRSNSVHRPTSQTREDMYVPAQPRLTTLQYLQTSWRYMWFCFGLIKNRWEVWKQWAMDSKPKSFTNGA